MEVKHYSKNRLRLKIELLKNNTQAGEELENKMKNLQGIINIKSNSTIGSVVINFDENQVEPVIVIGAILNLLGLDDEVFKQKDGKFSNIFKDILAGIDNSIYNKSYGVLDLKSSLFILLMYYGVKKFRENPVWPNGINLMWWAFGLLNKGGGNN